MPSFPNFEYAVNVNAEVNRLKQHKQARAIPGKAQCAIAMVNALPRHVQINVLSGSGKKPAAQSAARSFVAVLLTAFSISLPVFMGTAVAEMPTARPPLHLMGSGFRPHLTAGSFFTLTPQSDDFASGNSITAVNGTAQLSLDPANAYDNNYTVHYFVSVTINASSTYGTANLVVALETNDGSGWVERATYTYPCSYPSGPPPYAQKTCSSWPHEQKTLTVAGLGLNDNIRLKAKSFSTTNGAGGSFVIRGGDAGGSNPETYNGVTYTTDVVFTSFAYANAFPAGNQITAVNGLATLYLDPGAAVDNIYTVHYFVTVTINGHPTQYGTATVTIVIETNDGTGSGWIQRASNPYNCGYPSGPPPYSTYTCPAWSHEQKGITVTGLGPSDSIRLKVTSFSTTNGAGGSFAVRGGDAGGWNPETYDGVTYTSRVPRGVAVRPELGERQGFASTTGSQRFFVKNRAVVEATLSLDYSCTGLSNCSVTPTSFTSVPAGESRVVTLNYTVGAAGTTGTGMVKVFDNFDNNTLRDSTAVAVRAIASTRPLVSLVDVNPGVTRDLGACLTFAVGSAAFECGDLRLVHALPAIRTLNKAWVPTLVYNSAQADPYPIVAATVTLPGGSSDSVQAVLKVGGIERARGRWASSDWPAGATRRIALGFAATTDTTKVYDYTLEVARLSDTLSATVVSGKLALVNRRTSGFGAGWWLGGLERLEILADGNRLWVGGDGSARLYVAAGTDVWVASNLNRPDTLIRAGTRYVRRLPTGVTVQFNAAGQHDTTVNRLGQKTSFTYDTVGGVVRFRTIKLPTQGGGQTYTFGYNGSNQLTSVTSPGGRVTTLWVSTRVDSIAGPDNRKVKFTYEDASSRRILSRTDRRLSVTSFTYDAAKKLSRVHINLGSDSIRVGFRAVDVLGLATASPKTATDTANVYASVFGARQFTTGADSIGQELKSWLDPYSQPRRVVTALGHETLVRREDGQYAGLATQLTAPNQFVTQARYDGRGHILASIAINPLGDGQNQVTRYHWASPWDFADSLITPEGVVTTMGYDNPNGNRLWQQVGSDPARRVNFRYGNALAFMSSIVQPSTPADSVQYDVLGNVSAAKTPRGFWTSHYRDALGRDTLVVTPTDSTDKSKGGAADSTLRVRRRIVYTVTDRDTISEVIAPNRVQVARVEKRYDEEGNLIFLLRQSTPDTAHVGTIITQWHYDRANRGVAQISPDGQVDSTRFDPASNAVVVVTRRKNPSSGTRLSITMRFDALNRLTQRAVDSLSYPRDSVGIAKFMSRTTLNRGQPYYPNNAQNGFTVFADTVRFGYNVLGKDTLADNRDAQVRRSYYANGMLQAETLKVRTLAELGAGGNFTDHRYIVSYRYDRDGRRKVLKYPAQLAPFPYPDSARFVYDATTGALAEVWDPMGNGFLYHYNLRGEMDTLRYGSAPGAVYDARTYDPDGGLMQHVVSGSRRNALLMYDARQKLISGANQYLARDTLTATYTGLGPLRNDKLTGYAQNDINGADVRIEVYDTLWHDALGNLTQTSFARKEGLSWVFSRDRTYFYQNGMGRLVDATSQLQGVRDTIRYDSAGSVTGIWQVAVGGGTTYMEDRLSYYAADGSVRAADYRRADGAPTSGTGANRFVFEQYRYDAYGRRVWVRVRRECDHLPNPNDLREQGECRTDLVRRTVWDGFQELAEIQQPGGDADPVENDTASLRRGWPDGIDQNPLLGRVLYTNGPAVDQPLSLIRVGYADSGAYAGSPQAWYQWSPFSIIPLWNYRGEVDRSMFGIGALPCTTVNGSQRCVLGAWPMGWSALGLPPFIPYFWHGTVTESKLDKAQTLYRRFRVYDLMTGRFTQEDPLGLAGGLNLYGFANGDPMNFADPFGTFALKKWLGAAFGFAALVVTGGLGPALVATAATAAGSAAAAGVESLMTGTSFGDAFRRNFNISEAFLGVGALAAEWWGGGIQSMGANSPFSGYVQSNEQILFFPRGGLTFGPATIFTDDRDVILKNALFSVPLHAHELGHTIQFISMSAWGNPWRVYLGLGVIGFIAPYYNPWEIMASGLGGAY